MQVKIYTEAVIWHIQIEVYRPVYTGRQLVPKHCTNTNIPARYDGRSNESGRNVRD